jgi:peptidoglycan/xylan/chitin deacetylase (PgdA/CDA1 family)
MADDERQKVLNELRAWAGAGEIGRASHPALSRDQIIELAESGLVEVGSHSVTHPIFSKLSMSAQREEVQRSKSTLEEILGRPVTSFAYPFGSKSDYTGDEFNRRLGAWLGG